MSAECHNLEPHEFHHYETTIVKTCHGITACGEGTHPVHNFEHTYEAWCHGMCDCGDTYRSEHGPGDHK